MLLTILNGSSTTDAADWAEEYGIDHPVLADPNYELFYKYNPDATGWPDITFLERGLVVHSIAGYSVDTATIEELL